ncbi:hypothetical protein KY289_008144 [Solanum tuberosum]|nr:hypothetical protein KY289_008144 [Solanum tuberosum]
MGKFSNTMPEVEMIMSKNKNAQEKKEQTGSQGTGKQKSTEALPHTQEEENTQHEEQCQVPKTKQVKNQVAADQNADGGKIATSCQHNKGLHKETQVHADMNKNPSHNNFIDLMSHDQPIEQPKEDEQDKEKTQAKERQTIQETGIVPYLKK